MKFDVLDIRISGESHAEKIALELIGLEPSSVFKGDSVVNMLERRKSSRSPWSTPRMENDKAVFSAGLKENKNGEVRIERGKKYTIANNLSAYIKNENVKKNDYADLSQIPRPSHADYVAYMKDGKIESGGGRFSGRLTAMLCIAGGIAEDVLRQHGIEVVAYISSVGEKNLGSYRDGADVVGFDDKKIEELKNSDFAILNSERKDEAVEYIKSIAIAGDSVGGTIECVVQGLGAGELGENLFDGLESKISYSLFGVPAVKAVEFGGGFDMAKMRGSEANDAFELVDGKVKTATNNNGGINGGISNGMPLTLRVAIKPTPSISLEQQSVNLATGEKESICIKGRHDACIVPRAVPCVESAVALAILDEVLLAKLHKSGLKHQLCYDEMPLLNIREKIDDVDERLCDLLKERFDLVKYVGEAKKKSGASIKNKEREKEVIEAIRERMPDELKDYAERVFVLLMEESKDLQRKL